MNHPKLSASRAEIHPALRESPAIVDVDDVSATDRNTEFLHSFLQLADLKIEGGGDKIAMPIFSAEGIDVGGLQTPPRRKRSAKVPIRSLPVATGEEKGVGAVKYNLFPTIEENGVQKMLPLKVKARRSSSALGDVSRFCFLKTRKGRLQSVKNPWGTIPLPKLSKFC